MQYNKVAQYDVAQSRSYEIIGLWSMNDDEMKTFVIFTVFTLFTNSLSTCVVKCLKWFYNHKRFRVPFDRMRCYPTSCKHQFPCSPCVHVADMVEPSVLCPRYNSENFISSYNLIRKQFLCCVYWTSLPDMISKRAILYWESFSKIICGFLISAVFKYLMWSD